MVTLARFKQTFSFADDPNRPRVLVRPRGNVTETSWSPTVADIRAACIAILHKDTDLNAAASRLDTFIADQNSKPDSDPSYRVAFFDDEARIICSVRGDRLGKLAGGSIVCGSNYRIEIAPTVLTLTSAGIALDALDGAPHEFLRSNASKTYFASVLGARIDLMGSKAGLAVASGAMARSGVSGPPSNIALYNDLGLVVRFTETKIEVDDISGIASTVYRGTQGAILHAGNDFQEVAAFYATLDPTAPYDPGRSYVRIAPRVGSQTNTMELTLPNAPGERVTVAVPGGDWLSGDAPRFVFTAHPTEGSAPGKRTFEDFLSLVGKFVVPKPTVAGAVDTTVFGLVPGFSPTETLLPGAHIADEPLFISFDLGPSIDPRAKKGNGTDEADHPTSPVLIQVEQPGTMARHMGVTSWIRLHRGTAGFSSTAAEEAMLYIAEAPSARNLVPIVSASSGAGAQTVFDHAPLLRATSGFLPVLPARGVEKGKRRKAAAFDRGLLARERVKLTELAPSPVSPGLFAIQSTGGTAGTTPLGFDIETNAAGQPVRLVFARAGLGEAEIEFGLRNKTTGQPVPSNIIDALVRNKLFLVANRMPGELDTADLYFDNVIRVAGWQFEVAIPAPSADAPESLDPNGDIRPKFNTFVIVKNHAERSIEDLIGDISAWSRPDLFVMKPRDPPIPSKGSDPKDVQDRLVDFVNDAKKNPPMGKPKSRGSGTSGFATSLPSLSGRAFW